MNIFLYDPQDFSNVCTISRTLEFFWVKDCYVYDNHNLIREKYWKSYSRRLKTQSVWAFEKINFHKIEDYISFLKTYKWRKIITLLDEKADSLENYKPLENDIIIFGKWYNYFWKWRNWLTRRDYFPCWWKNLYKKNLKNSEFKSKQYSCNCYV